MIQERTTCRACGSKQLGMVLDLGRTALANDFRESAEAARDQVILPLRLCVCRECSLAQLADTVDPKVLYSHYAYVSSTSVTMDRHLGEQCGHLIEAAGLKAGSRVLEIASNTGVYLKKFQDRGCEVLGVEPAANIAELARKDGVPTRTEFFGTTSAGRIAQEWGKADLIVGRHVFAHIDDLRGLLAGLAAVSHPDSLIAFEVPYLVDFFEKAEFDTIYHEHLSYISVRALEALTRDTPFYLQRVDHYPIHGGSILFHFRHRSSGRPVHESVAAFLRREQALSLEKPASWEPFVKRVRDIQQGLAELIRNLRKQGRRVIGYGASAKGNTLLNTSGITSKDLDYIIDNTPFKQGKLAPGSLIPVKPPAMLLSDQPDYALILAWNFADEIIQRETQYQALGGRFIIPIPVPKIVDPAAAGGGKGSLSR